MKPLSNWDNYKRGYTFKQPTFYSSAHLGLDIICPSGTKLYAPSNGVVSRNDFKEGGVVLEFRTGGLVMRFMHLSSILALGNVNEGTQIALTGNTGTLSSGAHLHVDISKNTVQINNINNFIDPEVYWKGGTMGIDVSQASVTAWDMAYNGTTPTDAKVREDINYIANTRIGGGGDNIGGRLVTAEAKIKTLEAVKPGACSCGFTADDRKLLDKLKTLIKY